MNNVKIDEYKKNKYAVYIDLDKNKERNYDVSRELKSPIVVFDYNKEGELIGIEIIGDLV
jgi:uncharacterized protein YuzE